jgi:hypothetical protein
MISKMALCKGSQLSAKPLSTLRKGGIFAAPVYPMGGSDKNVISDESFIPDKIVYFTGDFFLRALFAAGRLLLF